MPDPIHQAEHDMVVESGPGVQPRGFDRMDVGGESAFDTQFEEVETGEFDVSRRSQTRMVTGRFVRHRLAMAALIVLFVMIMMSLLTPMLYKWDYETRDRGHNSEAPSAQHWFGTDSLGKDMFAKTMRGAVKSFQLGLIVAISATLVGVFVGALAGYYRGWLDALLMRFTDLFLTIPSLAVLLVLANRYRGEGSNSLQIAFVIALFAWMYQARLTRSEFLQLREREFVQAARAVGAGDRRIMFRHLIPNSIGSIIVNATLTIATAIITESVLSFLGFGVQLPDTSLGVLVADGQEAARTRWWLFYAPGLWLVLLLLCVNFVGDGLRDAFDPKQERTRA